MFVTPAKREARNEATILHADLDAFYASVEQRDDPRLRGRPVIVGGGVVLAASYEARAFGVRTAMGGRQALRMCPHAVVVEPRMSAYSEASKAVFEVFDDTTPLVEGLSIDEAFLDVGGLRRVAGTPTEIAVRLRAEVGARVGLPITVGVARTKFLAKVASRAAKPDGLLIVPPDAESSFLYPLPVEWIWGVGPATARKLHDRGVTTVADLAQLAESTLVARVTSRMRAAGRVGRTVLLRLRFDDFSRATRSHSLAMATAQTDRILEAVRALVVMAMPAMEHQGLTLIGVAVSNLEDAAAMQLTLPFDPRSRDALDDALDEVRDRFGSTALQRAVLIGRDPGLSVPLLPD